MDTQPKNIEAAFNEALSKLEADAKAAGTNITAVCREAGVSRTTPDRWKEKTPATIATLKKLQDVVAEKVAKQAPTE